MEEEEEEAELDDEDDVEDADADGGASSIGGDAAAAGKYGHMKGGSSNLGT